MTASRPSQAPAATAPNRRFRWLTLLFAFLLAAASWAYVDGRRIETKAFRVPLRVAVPEGWEIDQSPPRNFQATLQGPREQMKNIRPEELTVRRTIEPTSETRDEETLSLHIADDDIRTPPGIIVVEKEIDSFQVTIIRLLQQFIKVDPIVEGTPAPGFRKVRAEASPPFVGVLAPKGAISHKDSLECYPIDISGAERDVIRAVGVKPKVFDGRLLRSDTDVWVSVIIEPVPRERTFTNVPIRILQRANSAVVATRLQPATATVTVRAPQAKAEALTEEDLLLYVQLSELPPAVSGPAEHTVAVRHEIPEDVEVLKLTPPQVTAKLRQAREEPAEEEAK
jgi:hypothetical protein